MMTGTGLSKSSFWVYFEDRHALIRGLGESIADKLYLAADPWFSAPDSEGYEQTRTGIVELVSLYLEYGHVIRAFADAAGENHEIEQLNSRLMDRFTRGTAAHIRREQAAGHVGPLNAKQVARAIVLLVHSYLGDAIQQKKRPAAATLINTLTLIETRTLYGHSAPSPPELSDWTFAISALKKE